MTERNSDYQNQLASAVATRLAAHRQRKAELPPTVEQIEYLADLGTPNLPWKSRLEASEAIAAIKPARRIRSARAPTCIVPANQEIVRVIIDIWGPLKVCREVAAAPENLYDEPNAICRYISSDRWDRVRWASRGYEEAYAWWLGLRQNRPQHTKLLA